MKTIYNKVASVAIFATLAGSMASCVSETPFADEGEVLVKMNVMMNSAVTRAEGETADDKLAELYEKCVVTVRKDKDVLHQWRGVQNIPGELYMRFGEYTAEAWSGDSVSASLESEGKKYYKSQEKFTVNNNSASMQVTLNCTLANVVASVDEETINNDYVKKETVKVTFSHAKGSITLGENWADKCYFMMPNNDHNIAYKIEGQSASGEGFTKEGVIENVQSAHEYRLFFEYNPSESTNGGAFIQIVVEDKPVKTVEDNVIILGAPEFAWQGGEMTTEDQIVGDANAFETGYSLGIAAFNGFKSVMVTPSEESMFASVLPVNNGSCAFELTTMTDAEMAALNSCGITIRFQDNITGVSDIATMSKYVVDFSRQWLNSLPESNNPYDLTVTATDNNGNSRTMLVSVANTKKAMTNSAPVNVDVAEMQSDLTAVGAKSVTFPLSFDDDADVSNAALQYREVNTSEWTTQPINVTKAISVSVTVSGLKPGTEYEYRTVAGNVENGEYEMKSKIAKFTTETVFAIPNASMEDWSDYSVNSKVLLPAAGGVRTFWDTGNHGSATMSKLITNPNSDIKHSGDKSAELKSQFVGFGIIGKFAAGNLFVGEYKETKGTNGVIDFGRPYDGSHPSALNLWANYRPGTELKGDGKNTVTNEIVLTNGEPDHGQIYIAFTTGIVTVDTSDTSTLFNANADYVVGYGQVTWTGNFGPDGSLAEVNIPIEWKDKAKTVKPTHMIIVCSASKYGDFFTGCEGSTLYLDDFELVYE